MININDINTRIDKLNSELLENAKKYNRISYLRLISIALTIYFSVKFIGSGITFSEGLIIITTLIVFGVFVWLHIRLKKTEKRILSLKKVYERYIDRINGKWNKFEDIGEEFIDDNHSFSSDLDIFSKGSLFQLINCTHTFLGRKKLSDTLLLKGSRVDINQKQEAIEEISNKFDFITRFESLASLNCSSKNDSKNLTEFLLTGSKNKIGKVLRGIVFVLPIALWVSIFLSYITLNKMLLNSTYVLVIINIVLTGYMFLKGYAGFSAVTPFKRELKSYTELFKMIEEEEFTSKKLTTLKEELTKGEKASSVLHKLEKITSNIDMRYNPLAFLFLNIFFLWDYQCMFALEDFKAKYGPKIQSYIEVIGNIEEYISLSTIKNTNQTTCIPCIVDNKVIVQGEDVGHPLIGGENRVSNSVNMDNNILVITGSNMSGKTTYLRTIGINLILAYTGANVVASKFNCSYLNVVTSMRISDNLDMGISTFYAELLKIKKIIDASKEDKPMIFLIDEIFRGTNSQDRIVGAISVINNLSKDNIIGGISTHDFELCDINNGRVANYHFEEHYDNGKILFDYKIKSGISTTKNAKFLMRMVGIDIQE
ncbi:MAG: DNA mismatch repair protein MutS [Clostridium sp.]